MLKTVNIEKITLTKVGSTSRYSANPEQTPAIILFFDLVSFFIVKIAGTPKSGYKQ